MGFMDKAKKLADQAQSKLDEVQKQFNENQSAKSEGSGGVAVEYDEHGRPIAQPTDPQQPAATPGQGDPLGDEAAATPPPPSASAPPAASTEPPAAPAKPAAPPSGGSGLTSGDPLAG
jgi:hypothetical protein